RAILEHLRGSIEDLSPQIRSFFGPSFKGGARGDNCIAKILAGGVADIVQRRAGRRNCRQVAAALAAHKVPADVKLISFANVQARLHGCDFAAFDASRRLATRFAIATLFHPVMGSLPQWPWYEIAS